MVSPLSTIVNIFVYGHCHMTMIPLVKLHPQPANHVVRVSFFLMAGLCWTNEASAGQEAARPIMATNVSLTDMPVFKMSSWIK